MFVYIKMCDLHLEMMSLPRISLTHDAFYNSINSRQTPVTNG